MSQGFYCYRVAALTKSKYAVAVISFVRVFSDQLNILLIGKDLKALAWPAFRCDGSDGTAEKHLSVIPATNPNRNLDHYWCEKFGSHYAFQEMFNAFYRCGVDVVLPVIQ